MRGARAHASRPISMKLGFVLTLLLACSVGAATNDYEVVKVATVFSLYGGFSGRMSIEGQATFKIAQESDAAATFRRLLNTGTPAARLYALLGLKMISPDEFNALLPAQLTNQTSVAVLSGCIMGHRYFGSVAKEIAAGHWNTNNLAVRGGG